MAIIESKKIKPLLPVYGPEKIFWELTILSFILMKLAGL